MTRIYDCCNRSADGHFYQTRNKRTLDSRAVKVDFTGLHSQPSNSSLAPSQFVNDSEDDDGVLV